MPIPSICPIVPILKSPPADQNKTLDALSTLLYSSSIGREKPTHFGSAQAVPKRGPSLQFRPLQKRGPTSQPAEPGRMFLDNLKTFDPKPTAPPSANADPRRTFGLTTKGPAMYTNNPVNLVN